MNTRHWLRLVATVTAIASLGVFAACGDDDDDGGGGGGSGSDEDYVAAICEASLDFQKEVEDIDPESIEDEDDIFEALEEPFDNFLNALEDANPPGDVEDYHNDAVEQFREILDAIRDQDAAAIGALSGAELPDPPEDVEARFNEIAQDNEDCVEAGVFSE